MRFLARSLVGLLLTALTVGLIAYGGWRLTAALQAESGGRPPGGGVRERVYAVTVLRPAPRTVRPELLAYGEIASARRLELRAARAGRIAELSPAFLDGGAVEAGDLLFRLDPAEARSELARARIALAEAEGELEDSVRGVTLAERELAAAQEQRRLRERALKRQDDMRSRGVGTESAVEAAELALSAARQQVIARERGLAEAEARRARAEIGLRLARLAVDDAERALAETEMRAPFAGLLTEVEAAPGRRVSTNERLAVLVDPTRLEAAFPVSNAEYARLLDPTGALAERPARVSLDTGGGQTAEAPAQLIRAGAAAGAGRTGRTLFARLGPEAGRLLREGDFVAVRVREPPLEEVAVLPAAAATEDGRILVVGEGDRLEERGVRILRRQGDRLVVADAPFGARVVAVRKPQLGPGVKVEFLGPDGTPAGGAEDRLAAAEGDFIALSEDRRARLLRLVQADAELAEDEKTQLLDRLSAPRAPRKVVERLEARASGG